ncbi:hypothetical protein EYZ11_013408 [Aspergillus tanneri]|uniref:Uncharacterized protein n=1 Tax=Aspergillus tanneri TaxID=1220188 RepID=A0A4S3IXR1_9EURO|nr:hypothetical protein EYZ11_013408 [Aspergillus tanneri]
MSENLTKIVQDAREMKKRIEELEHEHQMLEQDACSTKIGRLDYFSLCSPFKSVKITQIVIARRMDTEPLEANESDEGFYDGSRIELVSSIYETIYKYGRHYPATSKDQYPWPADERKNGKVSAL